MSVPEMMLGSFQMETSEGLTMYIRVKTFSFRSDKARIKRKRDVCARDYAGQLPNGDQRGLDNVYKS